MTVRHAQGATQKSEELVPVPAQHVPHFNRGKEMRERLEAAVE